MRHKDDSVIFQYLYNREVRPACSVSVFGTYYRVFHVTTLFPGLMAALPSRGGTYVERPGVLSFLAALPYNNNSNICEPFPGETRRAL